MKRINSLILYLMIITLVMLLGCLVVTLLPFKAGVYEGNEFAVVLFIAISASFFGVCVLLTTYYMKKLVTDIAIENESIRVAVFLKVYDLKLDEADIKNLGGGKYRIVLKKKSFIVYIRLLEQTALRGLVQAVETIP